MTIVFYLKNREEVEKFETLLYQYADARAQFALKHISLVSAFDQLQNRDDGRIIFSALLDIQINFLLIYLDLCTVGATWNANFSKGMLEGGSVLDSPAKFFGKMDIHRFNTSYILRYRAIWDKLMGFLILIETPEKYKRFSEAKSKKRTFKKIATEGKLISEEFVCKLEELLTKFDNTFRTAEAHGTGSLRKYSFTMESIADNPQIELLEYWNELNDFISKRIGEKFGYKLEKLEIGQGTQATGEISDNLER